jgi:hypothetical protein
MNPKNNAKIIWTAEKINGLDIFSCIDRVVSKAS